MDHQSWPWRHKSLDKSPGESDSSGSASSHSKRFLDNQVLLYMRMFFPDGICCLISACYSYFGSNKGAHMHLNHLVLVVIQLLLSYL
jgi:hypothetical protein